MIRRGPLTWVGYNLWAVRGYDSQNQAFRDAVAATERKRLIIGGLHTEISLAFATVAALKNGYDAMFFTDAVRGQSQTAHRTRIERLAHAGALPSTALAVNTEPFRDSVTPLAGSAREVIYWCSPRSQSSPRTSVSQTRRSRPWRR